MVLANVAGVLGVHHALADQRNFRETFREPCTPHPTLYTLRSTSYALHPTPSAFTPHTLRLIPYALRPWQITDTRSSRMSRELLAWRMHSHISAGFVSLTSYTLCLTPHTLRCEDRVRDGPASGGKGSKGYIITTPLAKYRYAVLANVAGVVGVEDALADEGARHRVRQRRAPAWSP